MYKKVLFELFTHPGVLLPLTISFTCAVFSILQPAWLLPGLAAGLIAVGCFTTQLFNWSSVEQRVVAKVRAEEKQRFNLDLDELYRKLVKTKEPEDNTALKNLRAIYTSFKEDVDNKTIDMAMHSGTVATIDDMFLECVAKLGKSYELFKFQRKLEGSAKDNVREKRMDLMKEVTESVEDMAHAISELRSLGVKRSSKELQKLREKLEQHLEASKTVETQLDDLGRDDFDRFKEYEN